MMRKLLLIILCLTILKQVQSNNLVELQKLGEFFSSIGAPSPGCNDYIVFCDEAGFVVKIHDFHPERIGVMPDMVDQFARLESLRIDNGVLTGPLPESLFRSTTLKYLTLRNNKINSVLPQNIHESQLEKLRIRQNGMKGELPSQIGQMSTLKILDLTANSFSGKLPESFTDLKIQRLDLSYNHFIGRIDADKTKGQLCEREYVSFVANCFDERPVFNPDISHNSRYIPYNRYSLDTINIGDNLENCLHILNYLYNSFDEVDDIYISTGDLYLQENFEVLVNTSIINNVILNSEDMYHFFNRGLDGLFSAENDIVLNLSDDDYADLQQRIRKRYLFYKGYGFDHHSFDLERIKIKFEGDEISVDQVLFYQIDENIYIEYGNAENICKKNECKDNEISLIEDDIIEIDNDVVISKQTRLILINPTPYVKIHVKGEYVLDIEDSEIEIIIDDDDLIRQFYNEEYNISILEGNYRGNFSFIQLSIEEKCTKVEPTLEHSKLIVAKFNLNESECSGIAWYFIMVIVVGCVIVAIVMLFLLISFVKPVRYALFPFRKRQETDDGEKPVQNSKIYKGKSKSNPISIV